MSIRTRLFAYLAAVHVLMGGVAALLLRQQRIWLLVAELVFAASLVTGIVLVNRLLRALAFAGESAQFLQESDFTARFLPVGQPEVDRLIAVYNHMVDTLRAERQRLQEQHYFLSRILEVSPSGIVVLDYDGAIDASNPAASRLLPDARRGRPVGEAGRELGPALASLAAGETRVVPAPGGRRVRVLHGTFLDRGFPRSFFLLEELTEELRQSEKAAYEKLIRMMSHEVNNSVGASASLLQSSLAYAPQLRDEDRQDFEGALQIAIDRMAQLNAFMRGFADVVRLPKPARQPHDLRLLLDRIEGLVRPQLAERRIAWRFETAGAVPPVSLDPVQVEQALLNIVKNAIEAIGSDGRITVRLAAEEGDVAVRIEDTGPGITAAAREHLFTPFFTTKEQGQGIGLTMVQEILAAHGCRFSLHGPPGGPTVFEIRFAPGSVAAPLS